MWTIGTLSPLPVGIGENLRRNQPLVVSTEAIDARSHFVCLTVEVACTAGYCSRPRALNRSAVFHGNA